MAKDRDVIVSRTPDQVMARLRPLVGRENIFGFLDPTDKPVVGYVRSDRFRLRAPRGFHSNALQPYLYGWVVPHPDGTRVRMRISMHPLATGCVVLLVAAMIVSSIASLLRGDGARFFSSAGMTVLVLAFVALFRWMDRSREELLWKFADEMFQVPTNTLNPP